VSYSQLMGRTTKGGRESLGSESELGKSLEVRVLAFRVLVA
jgi:hypothetical protein